jgi:hypothetical protein
MRSWQLGIAVVAVVFGLSRVARGVEHIAAGVDLISGRFVPGQQPDGNSVLFLAPEGLIVMDTDRHAEHTQQLLDYAKNAGDVWVFDPATRVLAAGDLVTLPVPFLDTACPARWQTALDTLSATDFAVLIPGHGAPMQREQLESYRAAYAQLIDCAASAKSKSACIDGWIGDAGDLIATQDQAFARQLMDYYMDNALRVSAAVMAKRCS